MKIIADLHTHTVYSHGKGSIENNVKVAIEKSLKVIAISDHGPGHMGFGIKKRKYYEMRTVIDHLNQKYDDIQIFLGLEANVMNEDGDLDIDSDILRDADFILAGYHFGSMPVKFPRDLGFHYNNYQSKRSKKCWDKAFELNTKSLIRAMERYPILGITHPGAKGPINLLAVADVAAKKGILLEVNAHHGYLTTEDLITLQSHDVCFFVSSDAHHPKDVGTFDLAVERLEAANVSETRVWNSEYQIASLMGKMKRAK